MGVILPGRTLIQIEKNSTLCQTAPALWAINSDKIWMRRLYFHHFLVFCRWTKYIKFRKVFWNGIWGRI